MHSKVTLNRPLKARKIQFIVIEIFDNPLYNKNEAIKFIRSSNIILPKIISVFIIAILKHQKLKVLSLSMRFKLMSEHMMLQMLNIIWRKT